MAKLYLLLFLFLLPGLSSAQTHDNRNEEHWQPLGPFNLGGPMRALLADQAVPGKWYAGSYVGGLWVTTSGGDSWKPHPDIPANTKVSCLAQAPSGNIYLGTGYNYETDSPGSGMYRSTDGGQSFQLVPSTDPEVDYNWLIINKIAIHPTTGHIYAATGRGLMVSTTAGQTWENPIYYDPGCSLQMTSNAAEVEILDNGRVLAMVGPSVWVSDEGHQHCSYTIIQDLFASEIEGDIAYSAAEPNRIYVLKVETDMYPLYDSLWVSDDFGDTWKKFSPAPENEPDFLLFGFHGSFSNCMAVDPEDHNRLLIGGLQLWRWDGVWGMAGLSELGPGNDFYVPRNVHQIVFDPHHPDHVWVATNEGIYRSKNKGRTWEPRNNRLNSGRINDLAFDPQGNVIAASDHGGNWLITPNTWPNPTFGEPLPASIGYLEEARPKQGYKCEFSQIASGMFISDWFNSFRSSGIDFPVIRYPREFSTVIPEIKLWESSNDLSSQDSVTFLAQRDYNPGETIQLRSLTQDLPFDYTFTGPLFSGQTIRIQDPYQSFLITKDGQEVFLTRNALRHNIAEEWLNITPSPFSGGPTCFEISKDGNIIYVGTTAGDVWRITGINDVYPGNSYSVDVWRIFDGVDRITSLVLDPENEDNLLVTRGLFQATSNINLVQNASSGLTFITQVDNQKHGNLEGFPIHDAIYDINQPGKVWLATEEGLYFTEDIYADSVIWNLDPVGEFTGRVSAVRQQTYNGEGVTNYGVIYIATYGRGVWYKGDFSLPNPPPPPPEASFPLLQIFPNPATDLLNLQFNSNDYGTLNIEIWDVQGREVWQGTLVAEPGPNQRQMGLPQLDAGNYVIKINGLGNQLTTPLIIIGN